jgi:hypothetical protein
LAGMGTYYGMNTSQAASTAVSSQRILDTAVVEEPRAGEVVASPLKAGDQALRAAASSATPTPLATAPAAASADLSSAPEPNASTPRRPRAEKKRRSSAASGPGVIGGGETERDVVERRVVERRPSPAPATVSPSAKGQASLQGKNCEEPCKDAPDTEPTPGRRLQANPNATLHRSPSKLWVD